jgi:hypothetical protein
MIDPTQSLSTVYNCSSVGVCLFILQNEKGKKKFKRRESSIILPSKKKKKSNHPVNFPLSFYGKLFFSGLFLFLFFFFSKKNNIPTQHRRRHNAHGSAGQRHNQRRTTDRSSAARARGTRGRVGAVAAIITVAAAAVTPVAFALRLVGVARGARVGARRHAGVVRARALLGGYVAERDVGALKTERGKKKPETEGELIFQIQGLNDCFWLFFR